MEYTDHQRAEFRDAYARRFRYQLIMMGLFLATLTLLAFTDGGRTVFGVSESVLGPITIVVMVGATIFSVLNWRCPACRWPLGRGFNPKQCRKCGIELRRKEEVR